MDTNSQVKSWNRNRRSFKKTEWANKRRRIFGRDIFYRRTAIWEKFWYFLFLSSDKLVNKYKIIMHYHITSFQNEELTIDYPRYWCCLYGSMSSDVRAGWMATYSTYDTRRKAFLYRHLSASQKEMGRIIHLRYDQTFRLDTSVVMSFLPSLMLFSLIYFWHT